jgi:hypothetical protein
MSSLSSLRRRLIARRQGQELRRVLRDAEPRVYAELVIIADRAKTWK